MSNTEENNIAESTESATQKVDLELELEKMSNVEVQPAKQPEEDKLGQKTLDLLTPSVPPLRTVDNEIEAISTKKPKVIGNTRDIVREIQGIEVLLGTKTKGLYAKTRTEVEIILDQRKAQLLELNKPKEELKAPQEPQDDIFSQVKKPEELLKNNTDQPESPTDSVLGGATPETPKKPPVVHKKKAAKKVVAEDPLTAANSQMLYRMNMLFLFSVEAISEKYSDKLNTSFTGSTAKMAKDYDSSDYLKGIYTRVYLENRELINQYASPLSELALYNASILGCQATINLQDTIKKNN